MDISKILNLILAIALIISIVIIISVKTGKDGRDKTRGSDSVSEIENKGTLQKLDIKSFDENIVNLFADDWFLLTAGEGDKFNPMTISWGNLGVLWNQPVVTVYVRHNRYTFELIENGKYFTLCAFDKTFRNKLQYMGTHSGRNEDKIKTAGLTPLKTELGNIYYLEARLVIECEKVYSDDIELSNILDEKGSDFYKKEPIHRMYIGKVLNILTKK